MTVKTKNQKLQSFSSRPILKLYRQFSVGYFDYAQLSFIGLLYFTLLIFTIIHIAYTPTQTTLAYISFPITCYFQADTFRTRFLQQRRRRIRRVFAKCVRKRIRQQLESLEERKLPGGAQIVKKPFACLTASNYIIQRPILCSEV